MPKIPDAPLLDKHSLSRLLRERFAEGFSRLSDIPPPHLLHHGEKAAKRIAEAVRNGECIVLVGDYDVDGVSASALCSLFFSQIPYPLKTVIPNRFSDGYGVSPNILKRIDADLVFTVDNGINAFEAADICKERGIDLVITDHHTPSKELPDAYAVVDPKLEGCSYPFKEICGAQVAWLLMALVKKELGISVDMAQFMDLLALAVIADVMPLVGINRTIVQAGLKQMMTSRRPSSVIIREFINKSSINSEDIGFQIAPRLNSAGRLEDASIAFEFLIAESEEKAFKQFELLNRLNTRRKEMEADVTEEAMAKVNEDDRIIVVAGEEWNEGVVGIVASRLVSRFGRPAIVLSINGDRAKGSARSVGEVNIYDLIKSQSDMLDKFGGHKMAAGLSLNAAVIDEFRIALNRKADKLHPDDFLVKEEILGRLDGSVIDLELLRVIDEFEPYGEGNPRPRFLAEKAEVLSVKLLGADRSHSRVLLRLQSHERCTFDLMAFRKVLSVPKDRTMTCSYTLNRNEWGGKVSVQLMLEKIYGV
ncbi:MAG: single-stranded-DNA-specific exonuclease RecJ [Helicobacteraceae bacterium 4484_230]|nr:MAG: single-stranded-DNA-specific exonuclease RecJ [Helicobacteraceae bacterium 4484_230]